MQRIAVLVLVASGLAGGISCGDKLPLAARPLDPTDTTVRAIVVAPDAWGLKPGDHVQLSVSVDAGAGVVDRTVTWTSSDTAIASVSMAGLVTTSLTAPGGVVMINATSNANPTIVGHSKITVAAATPSTLRAHE